MQLFSRLRFRQSHAKATAMKSIVFVFVFGGLGSVLRHVVNMLSVRVIGPAFPWSTLFVNIVGCTLIGILARVLPLPGEGGLELRLMFMTGLCGGFTTFSAFSLDAANLWMRGDSVGAVVYVASSVVISLIGVALGLVIGNALTT